MKKILLQALRMILYPMYWCYCVIRDAPVICMDDDLISYGVSRQFYIADDPGEGVSTEHGPECGSICQTGFVSGERMSA